MTVPRNAGCQLALTDPADRSTDVTSAQPYHVRWIRVSPDEAVQTFAGSL